MQIRYARISDAIEIAKVQVDTWHSTYRGIVPDNHLNSMTYECQEQYWREFLAPDTSEFVIVAESDDKHVLGFSAAGWNKDIYTEFSGELHKLYVLKAGQGQGIGTLLLRATANSLRERRLNSMIVWVLGDNPFRGFYESLNGKIIAERTIYIGEEPLLDVAYGWPDLELFSQKSL
ncbi:MAG: GNAT family N-acetyltransferase [Acidobacteriota bacterium]|nr:GNAT family N-acetyltransferase [Acidobacteriota bacterium]